MVPDIDLQLDVAIRALRDVVAPAVDPGNKPALEQLHLSIATLGMARSRLPLQRRRVRKELVNAIELAQGVAAVAGAEALAKPLAEARRAHADVDADTSELDAIRANLLSAVSGVVNASTDPAADAAIAKIVVKASKPQFDLVRAWCLPSGFEPHPGEVRPLDQILGA